MQKRVKKAAEKTGIKVGSANYRKDIKDLCERCGFKAVDLCQMDIHHKDGNPANNAPENKENVCANCHRLIDKAQKQSPTRRATS